MWYSTPFIIPGYIPMYMDSFAERANNVNLCGGCCNRIDFPKLTIKPAAGVFHKHYLFRGVFCHSHSCLVKSLQCVQINEYLKTFQLFCAVAFGVSYEL